MSARLSKESMAELRRGSKLRQRLQMEVDDIAQQVQAIDYDIRFKYQQLSHVRCDHEEQPATAATAAAAAPPEQRQRDIDFLQSDIRRLEGLMTSKQQRLHMAQQDLRHYDEAMAEINEAASRDDGK